MGCGSSHEGGGEVYETQGRGGARGNKYTKRGATRRAGGAQTSPKLPPDVLPADAFQGTFDTSNLELDQHVLHSESGDNNAVIAVEFLGPAMDKLAYVTSNDRVPRLLDLQVAPLIETFEEPPVVLDMPPTLYDMPDGVDSMGEEHASPIMCMAGVRSGRFVATAAHDRLAIVWVLNEDETALQRSVVCSHSFQKVSSSFNIVAISPIGQTMVASGGESLVAKSFASDEEAGDRTSTVLVWRLAGERMCTMNPACFERHESEVMCLEYLGVDMVISGSRDGMILIWNIHTRNVQQCLSKHCGSILGLSCSNLNMLATVDSANLHLWNADSASCMFSVTSGDVGIPAIRGSAFLSSSYLFIIGFTAIAKLLDVTTGNVFADCEVNDLALCVSLAHTSGPMARVAVGCKNGTISLLTFSNLQ